MPDREKVIKGLKIHADGNGYLCQFCLEEGCPYVESPIIFGKRNCDIEQMCRDALAMLKEQEAVEPKTEPSAKGYWFTCGVCGWWLFEVRDTVHFDDRKRIHFCASCGQAVKWE